MAHLIDTSIAIFMRDRQPDILNAVGRLDSRPVLSIVSQIELEGGVYRKPDLIEKRRRAVDALLRSLVVLPFEQSAVVCYGRIVATIGYSRRKVVDRMIAATAMAHELTLITTNRDDFTDIPGLRLDAWPSP